MPCEHATIAENKERELEEASRSPILPIFPCGRVWALAPEPGATMKAIILYARFLFVNALYNAHY